MARQKNSEPETKDKLSEKWELVKLAQKEIMKEYGEESLIRLGDKPPKKYETISSGSIALDIVLGNGGYPKGRIVEIYGPESSGKTTVCLHLIAETQKQGGICAFIDVEHALDTAYAKNLGVDTENLMVSQPETAEEALNIAEAMVRSGGVDLVIVDSVASLVPQKELEGEMGDSHIGLQARLMSQAMRKLKGTINKSNCIMLFTNQIREKVGVMFGSPETTSGGRALKFYASIRLDIRRIEQLKRGTDFFGIRSKVTVVKNKCASPFAKAEFDIEFGKGISKVGEIADFGAEFDIVHKSGAWYSYIDKETGELRKDSEGKDCKWQGRDAFKEALRENPELANEIEARIRSELGME